MAYIRLFSLFSCIFTVSIALTSAGDNDVVPPRLAPLLAPQASIPGVDCNSVIYDMVDCISYLSVRSTATQPDPECCSGYKAVLKTDAECVCEAIKSAIKLGSNIDMKRAGALASACNIKAPSIDSCHVSNAPSISPVAAAVNPPTTGPSPVTESPAPAPHASSTAPVPHASPVSPKSPAPVPHTSPVSPRSPAPVPHTSPVSPRSSAPVPHASPSPKSFAPVPPTRSPLKSIAPVQATPLAPTPITEASTSNPKSSAYALASSTEVHFIVLVASFFYALV